LIQKYLDEKLGLDNRPLLILTSGKAAEAVCNFAEVDKGEVIQFKNMTGLTLPKDKVEKAKAFRQHTGSHVSSRRAEDFLIAEGILDGKQAEQTFSGDGESHAINLLKEAYGAESENDVYLANAGMNAVYSAYKSIGELQSKKGKDTWIQFGWL